MNIDIIFKQKRKQLWKGKNIMGIFIDILLSFIEKDREICSNECFYNCTGVSYMNCSGDCTTACELNCSNSCQANGSASGCGSCDNTCTEGCYGACFATCKAGCGYNAKNSK